MATQATGIMISFSRCPGMETRIIFDGDLIMHGLQSYFESHTAVTCSAMIFAITQNGCV
jgi:hypothetical protein